MATATLTAEKIFNVGAAGQDAIKWRLWKHASSTAAAQKYAEGALGNDPDALTANQFYRVRANQLVITQTAGTVMTEEFVKDELAGALKDKTTYLELFSDTGGAEFTTNRVACAAADWTVA